MKKTILYSTFILGAVFGISNQLEKVESETKKAEVDHMTATFVDEEELQAIVASYMHGSIEEIVLNQHRQYEVTVDQDGEMFDVVIDSQNGQIRSFSRREEHIVQKPNSRAVTIEQLDAIELALETVPGDPEQIELIERDQKWVYQVAIKHDNRTFNVIVDAYTGVVLDVNHGQES
ncbi:putative membrane protein YkoI [Alkalibacillus flavidus]|uniref:Membrane protein YkoI n=1 Tax=Alkalibacillus flavidus TaxID=546021 RepID=A0ABV2KTD2_9BACI